MKDKVREPNESQPVDTGLWGFRDERSKTLFETGYWWEDTCIQDALKVLGEVEDSEDVDVC